MELEGLFVSIALRMVPSDLQLRREVLRSYSKDVQTKMLKLWRGGDRFAPEMLKRRVGRLRAGRLLSRSCI